MARGEPPQAILMSGCTFVFKQSRIITEQTELAVCSYHGCADICHWIKSDTEEKLIMRTDDTEAQSYKELFLCILNGFMDVEP